MCLCECMEELDVCFESIAKCDVGIHMDWTSVYVKFQ